MEEERRKRSKKKKKKKKGRGIEKLGKKTSIIHSFKSSLMTYTEFQKS